MNIKDTMTENSKISVSSPVTKDTDDDFDYKAEDPWSLITSYFGGGEYLQRLVRHQLESYKDFVSHQQELQ